MSQRTHLKFLKMNTALRVTALAITCLSVIGCKPVDHDHGHSHEADAQSFSGAVHKEGKGITLLPETEKRLGVQLAEVKETTISKEVEFTARVFASETNGQLLASGWLAVNDAKSFSTGSFVTLRSGSGESFEGIVADAKKPLSTNETEIVVQFRAENVPVGTFLQIAANIPSENPTITIPREALIRGTTETFVYVQNGDAYLRTVVESGRENKDSVEIKDGLLEGDVVVTQGAMDLWLVELRAVKGGQGCCPAPPVKGKGT